MELHTIFNQMPGCPVKFDEKLAEEFALYLNKDKEKTMASVGKVTHQDVTDFIKLMVEIGGVHYIDDKYYIRTKATDDICTVTDKDKTEAKLKIYHNDRESGDYLVLNPFKETAVMSSALIWFNDTLEQKMRVCLKIAIQEMIDIALDNSAECNHQKMQLQNIVAFPTVEPKASMKEEINKIEHDDFLKMVYSKKLKKGQLEIDFGTTEVQAKYKTKVKVKTWEFLCDMIEGIFGCDPNMFHKKFVYTATTVGAPNCETTITLAQRFFSVMEPICKIIGMEIADMDTWKDQVRNIENYQRMTDWDDGIRTKPIKQLVAPWDRKPETVVSGGVPQVNITATVSKGVPQVIVTPEGIKAVGSLPIQGPMVPNIVYNQPMGTYPPQQVYGGPGPQYPGYPQQQYVQAYPPPYQSQPIQYQGMQPTQSPFGNQNPYAGCGYPQVQQGYRPVSF